MDAEFILLRRSLEQSVRELPPLPAAILKILDEMQSLDPSAGAVEAIVNADQALTAKLLRVVNSSYYGLARQISNVGQAVIILGLQQVRNITLAIGASSSFKANGPRQQEVMNEFWLHSFATSATAGLLAHGKGFDRRATSELQTVGLVGDIGRLFLFANFPKTFERLIKIAGERELSFDEAEVLMIGQSHAHLGGTIAERWGFPESMTEIIAGHEGPYGVEPSDGAKIIHMADYLNKGEYKMLATLPEPRLDPYVEAYFPLREEEWDTLKERTSGLVLQAGQSMGVMAA